MGGIASACASPQAQLAPMQMLLARTQHQEQEASDGGQSTQVASGSQGNSISSPHVPSTVAVSSSAPATAGDSVPTSPTYASSNISEHPCADTSSEPAPAPADLQQKEHNLPPAAGANSDTEGWGPAAGCVQQEAEAGLADFSVRLPSRCTHDSIASWCSSEHAADMHAAAALPAINLATASAGGEAASAEDASAAGSGSSSCLPCASETLQAEAQPELESIVLVAADAMASTCTSCPDVEVQDAGSSGVCISQEAGLQPQEQAGQAQKSSAEDGADHLISLEDGVPKASVQDQRNGTQASTDGPLCADAPSPACTSSSLDPGAASSPQDIEQLEPANLACQAEATSAPVATAAVEAVDLQASASPASSLSQSSVPASEAEGHLAAADHARQVQASAPAGAEPAAVQPGEAPPSPASPPHQLVQAGSLQEQDAPAEEEEEEYEEIGSLPGPSAVTGFSRLRALRPAPLRLPWLAASPAGSTASRASSRSRSSEASFISAASFVSARSHASSTADSMCHFEGWDWEDEWGRETRPRQGKRPPPPWESGAFDGPGESVGTSSSGPHATVRAMSGRHLSAASPTTSRKSRASGAVTAGAAVTAPDGTAPLTRANLAAGLGSGPDLGLGLVLPAYMESIAALHGASQQGGQLPRHIPASPGSAGARSDGASSFFSSHSFYTPNSLSPRSTADADSPAKTSSSGGAASGPAAGAPHATRSTPPPQPHAQRRISTAAGAASKAAALPAGKGLGASRGSPLRGPASSAAAQEGKGAGSLNHGQASTGLGLFWGGLEDDADQGEEVTSSKAASATGIGSQQKKARKTHEDKQIAAKEGPSGRGQQEQQGAALPAGGGPSDPVTLLGDNMEKSWGQNCIVQ